jgi:hypothetical protein
MRPRDESYRSDNLAFCRAPKKAFLFWMMQYIPLKTPKLTMTGSPYPHRGSKPEVAFTDTAAASS